MTVLLTYVTVSDILFLWLHRFLKSSRSVAFKEFVLPVRGSGPLLLAWLLYNLFLFTPHGSSWHYLSSIGTLLTLLLVFGRHEIPVLGHRSVRFIIGF